MPVDDGQVLLVLSNFPDQAAAQKMANARKPHDQMLACAGEASTGSNTNGNEIKASSEPMFDSA